jgi:zinc transport system substrate-binding protein
LGTAVISAVTVLSTVTACGSASGPRLGGGDGVAIVTGFYPLEWLARRVGGADATVRNLTKPGAEPHDLELSPRQVVDVAGADLVFYIKGVQPAVDKAVGQHAKNRALDAVSAVRTLPRTGADEHADEGGAQLSYDPHLWLDPRRFATVSRALGERLAKSDPAHAADYRARAKATEGALSTLDGEFQRGLAQCRSKSIVTGHSAFGYLANRYGLEQTGITGIDPNAEPSPARLAELARLVRNKGTTTIFLETNATDKVAKTLATEAKVKTATLNPVEAPPTGPGQDYLSAMRQNLAVLRTALDCR